MGVCGERSKFYEELVERLITYAEFEFKNASVKPDGATDLDHRDSAAKQMAMLGWKKAAAEVLPEAPPFPFELNYLWSWYCQHSLGLAVNGTTPAVVTWEGVAAWASLMDVTIEPWEVLVIIRLGASRANIASEEIANQMKQSKK